MIKDWFCISNTSNIGVDTFDLLLLSDFSSLISNAVIPHNPEGSIFKVFSWSHSADEPDEESDNDSCSQGDTERDEASSEKLTWDIPSKGEWKQSIIEYSLWVIKESSDDTTG